LKVLEVVSVAARALHDGTYGPTREAPQILVGDLQRTFHRAIHSEPPTLGRDRLRDRKVLYDVE
jgi:hypothetical protein